MGKAMLEPAVEAHAYNPGRLRCEDHDFTVGLRPFGSHLQFSHPYERDIEIAL